MVPMRGVSVDTDQFQSGSHQGLMDWRAFHSGRDPVSRAILRTVLVPVREAYNDAFRELENSWKVLPIRGFLPAAEF
jgi:hypothetical protein